MLEGLIGITAPDRSVPGRTLDARDPSHAASHRQAHDPRRWGTGGSQSRRGRGGGSSWTRTTSSPTRLRSLTGSSRTRVFRCLKRTTGRSGDRTTERLCSAHAVFTFLYRFGTCPPPTSTRFSSRGSAIVQSALVAGICRPMREDSQPSSRSPEGPVRPPSRTGQWLRITSARGSNRNQASHTCPGQSQCEPSPHADRQGHHFFGVTPQAGTQI